MICMAEGSIPELVFLNKFSLGPYDACSGTTFWQTLGFGKYHDMGQILISLIWLTVWVGQPNAHSGVISPIALSI